MAIEEALKKRITRRFIKELEAFKAGGYKFPSGKALFEGTQYEAFDAYLEGVKSGEIHGYFEIPTGVGKTALFIAIASCYLRAIENIPDAPGILIQEPTSDLVVQTARAFADFLPEQAPSMEADDEQGRQIDWANSVVDIQHTGRKGYTRRKDNGTDTKVVITTYQSQTKDINRTADKKIFSADDFFFVIYDEGHYITADRFGLSVNKFKDSIQLAVTATPEYSESKTVALKLQHRYYHLPLKTAIERRDLCHVRPLLIKTEFTVDIEKARKFLEQQQGKPLTPAQVQALLNQEARNQAVIKAYFTGSHPDTGERFLGQPGMLFAGGIAHCGDFIKQAEALLKKPKYKPVRDWLKNEGLALLAPIHSEVPKEGVLLTIGGEKKRYSEDQVKELHRRGKILLVISDQKLKLGTDFPRDSFVVDMVDRFSVVDAAQRMGRGFRVDREDEESNHPGDPDKSCAAINLIDQNTHEVYAGTRHYPIHAIEILEGAEFRYPGRKYKALIRFKQQPPEIVEGLEGAGFTLVTRTEALQDVTNGFKKGKKQYAPEGWICGNMTDGKYIGGFNTFKKLIPQLIEEKRNLGFSEEEIKTKWAGVYNSSISGKEGLYVSPAALEEFEREGKLKSLDSKAPLALEGWMSIGMMKDKYIGTDITFNKLIEGLIEEKRNLGLSEEEINAKWVGVRSGSKGKQSLYTSPIALAELEREGKLRSRETKAPPVPEGWMSGNTMNDKYMVVGTTYNKLIKELIEKKLGQDISEEEVRTKWAGLYSHSKGRETLYASPKAIEELKREGKLRSRETKAPPVPEGWMSGTMLMSEYVGGGTEFNELIKGLIEKKLSQDISEEEVRTKWAGLYSNSKGYEALNASPDAIKELEREGKLRARETKASPVPEDWMSGTIMNDKYIGGGAALNKLIKGLIEKKLSQGISEKEVQTKWAGLYTNSNGNEALYASPKAIEELKLEGKLRSRETKAPPVPEGWMSGTMLMSEYVGGDTDLKKLIKGLIEKKLGQDISEEEIKAKWAGLYSGKTGKESLYASPKAIAELERDGLLRKREVESGTDGKPAASAKIKPREKPEKKDTSPNGAHTKNRTGFGRGQTAGS